MEKALADGFYLAGFISYEAGYAFEKLFQNERTYGFPLVCFGAYASPLSSPISSENSFPSPSLMERGAEPCLPAGRSKGRGGVRMNYLSALRKIKHYLSAGETYQVNYTFKQKFIFRGAPHDLYQRLKRKQATPYSAFIETDKFTILSLSPELFFRKKENLIEVKPMKGTIVPGKGNMEQLRNDPKNRSENLMIVDLLRNDLGRFAKVGTVKTTKLFEVEEYETLYQMTSTIEARVPHDIELHSIFKNLFPSGSVTGAPKIRTMQIIRELEKEDRNIYCGSIGFITPRKDMLFNIAIRTIRLKGENGEIGIGSGITYDSDPEEEYKECLLKAKFMC